MGEGGSKYLVFYKEFGGNFLRIHMHQFSAKEASQIEGIYGCT